jgi:hypothetical protein
MAPDSAEPTEGGPAVSDERSEPNYDSTGRVVRCPVCLSTRTWVEDESADLGDRWARAALVENRTGDGPGLVAWCLDCGMRLVHLPEPGAGDPLTGMTPAGMAEMLRILQGVAREERRRGAEPQDDFERGLQMLAECHDLLHRPFTVGCWRTAGGPARHLRYWWTCQFWPPLWLEMRRWAARAIGKPCTATEEDAAEAEERANER